MEKMTIHRALTELKLADAKIEKQTTNLIPVGLVQKDGLVNGRYEKTEFEKDAISKFDSVKALIDRKRLLKTKIVESNAETTVTIGNVKMTVADAIVMKELIKFKKVLLKHLESANEDTQGRIQVSNEKINDQALRLAEVALGKESVKLTDKDVESVVNPYIEKNKFSLVDSLKIDKTIESLTEEIENFESEVDAVLSESNAVTLIEF